MNLPMPTAAASSRIIAGHGRTGLAARRIVHTACVELCELSNRDWVIRVSAQGWSKFLEVLAAERQPPSVYGDIVVVTVKDYENSWPLFTSRANYVAYNQAAAQGRLDRLISPSIGRIYGPWITATGSLYEAEDEL